MIELPQEVTQPSTSTSSRLPPPLVALERIARNYWWSWSFDGPSVFRDLAPDTWEECEQNPLLLLSRTSEYQLAQMAADPAYVARVRELSDRFEAYLKAPSVLQKSTRINQQHPVAYFCAEFGVHNSLPLYSGGLGILAGDHLKSASDLNLPFVGIGLLYRFGYFRQRLRRDGWQEEHYGETHPDKLPIHKVHEESGTPLTISLSIRERTVHAQVWRADVGRVHLYLLDTNIPQNQEIDRLVTGHLYGGDRETRVVQEMLLGIGGVRMLRKLNIDPAVFHLNEGHSAFLTLELARELIQHGLSFHAAAKQVRELCVFTTHTPVAAGNDEFEPDLIAKCFGSSYEQELGLTHEEFLALGRVDASNSKENFGLTPLAIRMSRSTNGVSRKHGEVSRALWRKLWPERTTDQIPITHVTNGVHAPTWVAPAIASLYRKYVDENWQELLADKAVWSRGIASIADEELWLAHSLLKRRLIEFVRKRSYQARLERGENAEYIEGARTMFDHEALTIGFARRIAGYKRWGLLLTDPDRLLRIINQVNRPVQFVFAGKAHPQDQGAKLILQHIAQWKYDVRIRNRAVFIQDYDQEIARQLVQSVDVWLNVPRRPQEASGTSGEKVALNGGLNLSVLDGWWLEGYDGSSGFAVGGSTEGAESDNVDTADAESLYRVLEQEVVPLYYDRDSDGLPRKWIAMMKHSIATLAPQFNSDRMVQEYAERIYS